MKMKRAHRVPLSPPRAVLAEAEKLRNASGLLLPSRSGRPLSDMTLSKLVKELGFDADVHGFRTSFRIWAQERTSFPREVAEMALAHVNKDRAEVAYARSDLIEKRREMMDAWAAYLAQPQEHVTKPCPCRWRVAAVSNWRLIADAGRWADLNWCHLPHEDRPELLERLRRAVPTTKDENGMEVEERHVTQAETKDRHLKAAALILRLGEPEAAISGDPPEASERWADQHAEVIKMLCATWRRREVTKGSKSLAKRTHVRNAVATLKQIRLVTRVLAAECDDEHEAQWLREDLAEMALLCVAFTVEAQRALGKDMERFAVSGRKSSRGGKLSTDMRRFEQAAKRRELLAYMEKLVAEGQAVEGAAYLATRAGIGTSEVAVWPAAGVVDTTTRS